MGVASHEARTVHHIGETIYHGFQQQVVFLGVVLQVSILHDDIVAGSLIEAAVQSCAFSHVFFLFIVANIRFGMGGDVVLDGFLRLVFGTVINQNQLFGNVVY